MAGARMTAHPLPHFVVSAMPPHWARRAVPATWPWQELLPLPPLVLADGSGPAVQQTAVRLCHTESVLHVRFDCADRDIWGTYRRRDDPIYDEEVVELFLAPGDDDPVDYFEFEISPHGVLLDAHIHNPTGERPDLRIDLGWDCPGIAWHSHIDAAASRWWATLSVPLAALCRTWPLPVGWRANFFRIERPRDGADEFSCWSPTLTRPADFHKPVRFGLLEIHG